MSLFLHFTGVYLLPALELSRAVRVLIVLSLFVVLLLMVWNGGSIDYRSGKQGSRVCDIFGAAQLTLAQDNRIDFCNWSACSIGRAAVR